VAFLIVSQNILVAQCDVQNFYSEVHLRRGWFHRELLRMVLDRWVATGRRRATYATVLWL
jgi:hypothetical protein